MCHAYFPELFAHSCYSNVFSQVVPIFQKDFPLKVNNMQHDLGLLEETSYLYC